MQRSEEVLILEAKIIRIFNKSWVTHRDKVHAARFIAKWKELTNWQEPIIEAPDEVMSNAFYVEIEKRVFEKWRNP